MGFELRYLVASVVAALTLGCAPTRPQERTTGVAEQSIPAVEARGDTTG